MSKVAMSICALMVAGALTDIVGSSMDPGRGSELDSALADLQATASRLSSLQAESVALWTIPELASGGVMDILLDGQGARASSEGTVRGMDIAPRLHTWLWDGRPMNWTAVGIMDDTCPALHMRSGDVLTIHGTLVPVEDSDELLLFASPQAG